MSKELEYIQKQINIASQQIEKSNINIFVTDRYKKTFYEVKEEKLRILKNIESAIQRLEAIDNSNPSEALKCLDRLDKTMRYADSDDDGYKYIEPCKMTDICDEEFDTIKQALLKQQEQEKLLKSGDLSDGYHTFNQLYYQRCVLFASLVRLNKDKSWKSFKHSDGKYCFDSNGEWFIVGIDTPIGSYTYHYEKKYWNLFECQELECGKEWDGHTKEDVSRLLSLPNEQKNKKYLKWEDLEWGELRTVIKKEIKIKINGAEYGLEFSIKFGTKEAIIFDEQDFMYAVFNECHKQFFNDLRLERVE